MNIKKGVFNTWMKQNHKQIGNPKKYSSTITTISNHLKKQNISDTNLFSIDSYSETEKLKELYFLNTELFEKNDRGNRMYSRAFDLYIEFLKDNYKSETISDDIINIYNQTGISDTEKRNYILSRIGQGKFRKELIDYWKACSITRYSEIPLLIASHIKPWRESDNFERLDFYNGLLLTPNLDKVFDLGLISFSNVGKIIISELLENYQSFGINKEMKINFSIQHIPYIEFHRNKILKIK